MLGTNVYARALMSTLLLKRSVFDLERVYVNGGRWGYLVGVDSKDLRQVLAVKEVEVAVI